ncbi:hypothetical protein LSAT2_001759 [Lamellibrachia satsuma]|nr:hypothetical protein LSAT2_001759 [Lamellibrachia satsuma]
MLIYFWVVLVISPAGFLEDLLGCSAICIICDSYHIVSLQKLKLSPTNCVGHQLNQREPRCTHRYYRPRHRYLHRRHHQIHQLQGCRPESWSQLVCHRHLTMRHSWALFTSVCILQPQFNYPDATFALQNTIDMEVTLPPLKAPRVVQEDSIADETPQAYESETEDNDDPGEVAMQWYLYRSGDKTVMQWLKKFALLYGSVMD